MAYRNGTYIAFDGQGTTDPTKSDNKTVCAIHVAFKEKSIMEAINQFSVNSTGDNVLDGPLYTYSESAYEKWGYK